MPQTGTELMSNGFTIAKLGRDFVLEGCMGRKFHSDGLSSICIRLIPRDPASSSDNLVGFVITKHMNSHCTECT